MSLTCVKSFDSIDLLPGMRISYTLWYWKVPEPASVVSTSVMLPNVSVTLNVLAVKPPPKT